MSSIPLPYNEDYEFMVLSCMLSDSKCLKSGTENLIDKDFYNVIHCDIFKAIQKLSERGVSTDSKNLMVELRGYKASDPAVLLRTILDLSSNAPDLEKFNEYSSEISESRRKRELIFLSIEIGTKSTNENSSELINHLNAKVNEINRSATSKDFISDVELSKSFKDGLSLSDYYEKMGKDIEAGIEPYMGIPSHFNKLDSKIGGFFPSSLTFIGARTSMGKTTFAINLIANQVYNTPNPPKILVMSLEMQVADLKERLLCVCTGVSSKKAKMKRLNRFEADKLIGFEKKNPAKTLFWEGTPLSIGKLRSKIKSFHQKEGIEIVYIDLLSKLKSDTPNASFQREVSEITRGLQDLVLELEISIVCLAQLNREATSRSDRTPQLSDFKNSGSIEEDSDLCLMIHRPEYYEATDKPGITQIIVAKNRLLGELGKVEFRMENGRMKENLIDYAGLSL